MMMLKDISWIACGDHVGSKHPEKLFLGSKAMLVKEGGMSGATHAVTYSKIWMLYRV